MHLSQPRHLRLRQLILICVGCVATAMQAADFKVAGIFTDHMVLQQGKPAAIWGTAAPGEPVAAEVGSQTRSAITGADGRWKLVLEPLRASATPVPFKVTCGTQTVALDDVLVGEVWFAAGQSNMTMPVRETQNAPAEIASATDPAIREFNVQQRWPYAQPRETTDRTGSWIPASPGKVGEFSATGYYFARELRRQLNVPVGIIHASAGGIAAETLTPPDALAGIPELQYLVDERGIGYGRGISEDEWNRRKKAQADFWSAMESPDTDDRDWERAPTLVTDNKVRAATWFRYHFTADDTWKNKKAVLRVLKVAGVGRMSLNGKKLYPSAGSGIDVLEYKLAPGDVRAGDNTVAFRINGYALNNTSADACSVVDAENRSLVLPVPAPVLRKSEADGLVPPDNLSLLGNLFNGMVAPYTSYQLRGVIWYQGEANVPKSGEYRTLFPALITGWRRHWEQPALPFVFVQLAGFMDLPKQPAENSDWAKLRAAQADALKLPATAMAVALDLGDAKLIHPKNKQEVGRRLSLAALTQVYGRQDLTGSGPVYAGHTVEAGKVRISFSETGGGLSLREGDTLKGFAIAEKTGAFVWADARILDERTVLLSSPQVKDPARILYAWSHNSDANLANKAGLPAVPFRAGTP
ncbi:MAG TPA: sialate O-acetylesterase [Rariglobus sp.]|nr:sialate O-acetylesterase [Rariglobus sp.]